MTKVISHLDHGANHQDPKIIVVHSMGEYIAGHGWEHHAVQFLNTLPKPLSAHSLVAPDGTNYRCRKDTEGAYHALNHNTDSLGIEFLVEGNHNYSSFLKAIKDPYLTKLQYEAGVEQVREWIELYDIHTVVRHSDLSPERKVDPGDGFPWDKFLIDVGV